MKWCILLTNAPNLSEFLGNLSYQVIESGDECIVVANSKIAQYDKKKYFPKDVKIFSKIDWCIKNYKKEYKEFNNLSWKIFFPTFVRKSHFKFFKFNYINSVEIISQIYQFINYILQREKPDLLINESPANIFTEIAYHLCKKYDIPYLGLIDSRIEGRVDIYNLEHTCSKYEESFNKLSFQSISSSEKKFAKDFIKNFISHKQLPSGTNNPLLYFHKINLIKYYSKRVTQVYQPRLYYLKNRKIFKYFDYESEATLKSSFQAPLNALQRKFRSFYQRKIVESINNNDNFFLFPLHFQPEASTSALATYFYDQVNTVKNIAFSLPFPYKLYVKEHPIAIGTRSGYFYKELKKIPNVVLVSPYENVENLIKKSHGVITLTSTIGMETALLGKPVYVLGNVFYSYHPLCRKIDNFDMLRERIKQDLKKKPNLINLEEVNNKFIISYYKNTISGNTFIATSNNDTNNYREIYKNIKKMFIENKN